MTRRNDEAEMFRNAGEAWRAHLAAQSAPPAEPSTGEKLSLADMKRIAEDVAGSTAAPADLTP